MDAGRTPASQFLSAYNRKLPARSRGFCPPLRQEPQISSTRSTFGGVSFILSRTASSLPTPWRDYARGNRQCEMTVSEEDSSGASCSHGLPRGFERIRNFGFLANAHRAALLPLCRHLLGMAPRNDSGTARPREPATWRCPVCQGCRQAVKDDAPCKRGHLQTEPRLRFSPCRHGAASQTKPKRNTFRNPLCPRSLSAIILLG